MKNVMITGCASGIGLATARKFIDEGYTVCGMSRRKMDSKEIIDNSSVVSYQNTRAAPSSLGSNPQTLDSHS